MHSYRQKLEHATVRNDIIIFIYKYKMENDFPDVGNSIKLF